MTHTSVYYIRLAYVINKQTILNYNWLNNNFKPATEATESKYATIILNNLYSILQSSESFLNNKFCII